MRLDKFLCDTGFGTRSEVKKIIRDKLVSVNDVIITKADFKVDEVNDVINVDGFDVSYKANAYYMLNKPKGYVSSTSDKHATVLDLIYENDKDLFPCGRLDKDTEGLLLITNDGDLAHKLLSPKNGIEKEYYVVARDIIDDTQIKRIESGVEKGGVSYLPAKLINIKDNECHIIVTEGKFHEIKEIFLAVGNEVTYLKRIRMHNLTLDESLASGEYRELSEEEINKLKVI